MKIFRLDECSGLQFLAFIQASNGLSGAVLLETWRSADVIVPNAFLGQPTVQAMFNTDCEAVGSFIQSLSLPTSLAESPNKLLYEVREQQIELGDSCGTGCIQIRASYHITARLELLFL